MKEQEIKVIKPEVEKRSNNPTSFPNLPIPEIVRTPKPIKK